MPPANTVPLENVPFEKKKKRKCPFWFPRLPRVEQILVILESPIKELLYYTEQPPF